MSKLRISARIASFFAALLVATSVLTLIPTPAGAVQTPESVVVNPDPADWTPDILDGQVNAILQMGTKVIVGGTFTQVRRHGFSLIITPQLPLRVRHGHRGDRSELRAGPQRRGRRVRTGPGRHLGLRRRRLQHRQRPELQEARPSEPLRRQHRHQLQGEHQRSGAGSRPRERMAVRVGQVHADQEHRALGPRPARPGHRERRPQPQPAVHQPAQGHAGRPRDRRHARTAPSSSRSAASARSRVSRGCRSRCST